jgi:hypothetical protein
MLKMQIAYIFLSVTSPHSVQGTRCKPRGQDDDLYINRILHILMCQMRDVLCIIQKCSKDSYIHKILRS